MVRNYIRKRKSTHILVNLILKSFKEDFHYSTNYKKSINFLYKIYEFRNEEVVITQETPLIIRIEFQKQNEIYRVDTFRGTVMHPIKKFGDYGIEKKGFNRLLKKQLKKLSKNELEKIYFEVAI